MGRDEDPTGRQRHLDHRYAVVEMQLELDEGAMEDAQADLNSEAYEQLVEDCTRPENFSGNHCTGDHDFGKFLGLVRHSIRKEVRKVEEVHFYFVDYFECSELAQLLNEAINSEFIDCPIGRMFEAVKRATAGYIVYCMQLSGECHQGSFWPGNVPDDVAPVLDRIMEEVEEYVFDTCKFYYEYLSFT